MSFFKKTIILSVCFFATHTSFGMNKFSKYKFKKIINDIASRHTSFKTINKKFSKILLQTKKHTSMWKSYTLGACLTGYALWNFNQNIECADAEGKKKKWKNLTQKEKNYYSEKYIKSKESITVDNFKKGSKREKNAMIHAISEHLKNGESPFEELYNIYRQATDKQKNIVRTAIVLCLAKGESVSGLANIYEKSDSTDQKFFAKGIAACLNQGKLVPDLDKIYAKSEWSSEREILAKGIAACLNQGKLVPDLDKIYAKSEWSSEREILARGIAEYIKLGKDIDMATLEKIYNYKEDDSNELVDALGSLLRAGVALWFNDPKLLKEEDKISVTETLDDAITEWLKTSRDYLPFPGYSFNKEQQKILQKSFIHELQTNKTFLGIPIQELIKTQSGQHLLKNSTTVAAFYSNMIHNKPQMQSLIKTIFKSEFDNIAQGYSVFYCAKTWKQHFNQVLYTTLWRIKHQHPLNHYIFPQFAPDTCCEKNAELICNEKELRIKRMQEDNPIFAQDSLLLSDYGLFSNSSIKKTDDNSHLPQLYYFLQNANPHAGQEISSLDIFKLFELEQLYHDHKQEIDTFEKNFLKLSCHGIIMQISIPKEDVNKHVYLAWDGGKKVKSYIEQEYETVATDNVAEVLETLKNNPQNLLDSDRQTFAIVFTPDVAQEAVYNKTKIISFNTADPEKLEETMNEMNNFLSAKLEKQWPQFDYTPWDCYRIHKQK